MTLKNEWRILANNNVFFFLTNFLSTCYVLWGDSVDSFISPAFIWPDILLTQNLA